MPANITFSHDGRWVGGSRIPLDLLDTSNLSVWTDNFVKEFKELGKKYLIFMAKDQTLIGQERVNLAAELNDMIAGLLILRRYLTVDFPSQFASLDNTYHFDFSIRIEQTNWSGRGFIHQKYTFKINKFQEWYNDVLMKKLQQFFKLYAEAMSDGKLTEEERIKLITFIETAIFDILVIEKMILSVQIDT